MRGPEDVTSQTHQEQIRYWIQQRGGRATESRVESYEEILQLVPVWIRLIDDIAKNDWWHLDELLNAITVHIDSEDERRVGEVADFLGPGGINAVLIADDGVLVLRRPHLKALRDYLNRKGEIPLEELCPAIYHPWGR